jgi:hypothetical protein
MANDIDSSLCSSVSESANVRISAAILAPGLTLVRLLGSFLAIFQNIMEWSKKSNKKASVCERKSRHLYSSRFAPPASPAITPTLSLRNREDFTSR